MIVVNNFEDKKLVQYLEKDKPKKVLILFGHGWGDTIMFMPLFYKLKRIYPEIHFDLYVECGQEEIFESYPTKDSQDHDIVFSLNFPMSEGTSKTKAQKCCIDELGIEYKETKLELPNYKSPFVACHFQGTALPNSVNCPEHIAAIMWQEIKEFGKIPIECHFEHCFHNPVNEKYDFIDLSVRKYKSNLQNLIGLIQSSFAFIGVASGPFVTAMSIMPEATLYLERNHKLRNYTIMDIVKVDIAKYEKGMVFEWLNML